MFSNLSASSISLATVTPSFVIRGAPNDLSSTTLRPFGPRVTFTALARMSTPRSMRSRASTPNLTSLADMVVSIYLARSQDRATGQVLEDEIRLAGLNLRDAAAPNPQNKENWLALTLPFSWRRADRRECP